MLDDLTWAGTAAEVLQHTGKFVVIYNRRVVAVGIDRQALVEDAAARVGRPWWGLAVALVPGDELLTHHASLQVLPPSQGGLLTIP